MQKIAYTVFSSNTLQMLCFFDRFVKLFAFLHWELATVSSTIQHSTPAVFIGHSLPPPVFICPHCTVFLPFSFLHRPPSKFFFLFFYPSFHLPSLSSTTTSFFKSPSSCVDLNLAIRLANLKDYSIAFLLFSMFLWVLSALPPFLLLLLLHQLESKPVTAIWRWWWW